MLGKILLDIRTMKKLVIIIALLPILCFGQKQGNIWYFGNYAGIDFNSGNPKALLNGQIKFPNSYGYNEGSSSISDNSGSLLFYTDGMTVWNKNHQIMDNGSGLLGNYSSTQSSIIVPDPANPSQYFYIFTVSSLMGSAVGANPSDGLRYSKVDMCLDNSLGGIIPTEKNIKLAETVAEKIAVTRHSNGIDYWIVTHKFYSNEFWAFKLTSSGITDTIITAIGTVHNGDAFGVQGQLKFSPNGKKIAVGASNGLEILDLFDFDKTSGSVSNSMSIAKPNNDHANIYGVEFSPDNSKLYVTGETYGLVTSFLVQYDLNANVGSLSDINASMVEIFKYTTGMLGGKGLQLAPNGKIYWVNLSTSSMGDFLACVNNPNIAGLGCDHQDLAVYLGGKKGSYTLPSFISGYSYSNEMTNCNEEITDIKIIGDTCNSLKLDFQTIGTSSSSYFLWNFGDPSSGVNNTITITNLSPSLFPIHIFSSPGVYNVCVSFQEPNSPISKVCRTVTIGECCKSIISSTDSCFQNNILFSIKSDAIISSITWNFDDPLSGANNTSTDFTPKHIFSTEGNYNVTANVTASCGSFEINYPLAIIDCSINCTGTISYKDSCLQEETLFQVISDSKINSITWDFDDPLSGVNNTSTDLSPTHLFSREGTYNVRSIVNFTCGIDTIFKTLIITNCDTSNEDCQLFIPNVFTPNGDGINDFFYPLISSSCLLTEYEMLVYNRWGVQIYKTTNQTDKWDGKYNGQEGFNDVYIYLITYKTQSKQTKTIYGTVKLLK